MSIVHCPLLGCRGVQHVFDENAVAGGGVVDEDMGDGTDEPAVLDDGGATRPLPVAEEGRGASGSGLCATQPHRRQGAHRVPQQESRTLLCQAGDKEILCFSAVFMRICR